MRWMATAVAVVLLVLLVVGSAPGAAGDEVAPGVRRVTSSPVNRDGRSCLVMWALSHGPYVEFTPDGWYSDLVDLLEANDYIGLEDNGACALNTFACLCASDSPVESSSWGTIKALFR